ncbi:MAG: DNA repair protein RecN [Betaproteobacteria bacterium]|nr:DNA repair protein RecN [Betaproteobacteria bacterium]
MLLSLALTDFVLVERLELNLLPGFGVLTGETGAGKSILLDAIALVLGERAEAGVVREGASRAEIAAEFDIPGGLRGWLEENDLAGEDDVLLLRRVVEATGRSRAFINGRSATAQQLKEAGAFLVDIHGQHAHYSLLKAAEQRRLLDEYAGSQPEVQATAEAFRTWRTAAERRRLAASHAGEAEAERERLEWTVRELTALEFTVEGWQSIQDEHRRLAHAAELIQGAQAVAGLLEGEEEGALARLRLARGNLADLAEIDPALSERLDTLQGAIDGLHDTARELTRYAERMELDDARLAELEARIAAIQAAARKFRLRPEEIPEHLAQARAQREELGASADLEALARAEAEAEASWRQRAEALSCKRKAAASRLEQAATDAMQQLAMKGGCFGIALLPCDAAAHGQEEVEFQVLPHAGQGLKPLAKTASGGELSRIGLVLQTVLSGVSGAPTLIFDEVDAGIGGGVAEIVGRLLSDLGSSRQVLCVTHLPQVAACAAWHCQVSKETVAGSARSRVEALDAAARVGEIARMLGGVRITEATRQHAAEMLGTPTPR